MHVRVLAVGRRQPDWVDLACRNYAGRLPRTWCFRLETIDSARGRQVDREGEGERLLARLAPRERLIALDERGRDADSTTFARWFERWQADGRDIAFAIGGADGHSSAVLERAEIALSLSRLTLAHGLARAVLLEQLYRCHTLMSGHPYHRA